MKLAPVARALAGRSGVEHRIVHTGQHYDATMSATFFRELDIQSPDVQLNVGSDSHARQTAAIMERFEATCVELRPDIILVYGDVNSTVAAALVAAKMQIPVGHVEAGLRSGDRTMPEEVNRVVTDALSTLLFTPSRDANANLKAEGVADDNIHLVGNVMIDSLVHALPRARQLDASGSCRPEEPYVLVTLHRPANVDDPANLTALLVALEEVAREKTVVFPVHPRTRARLDALDRAVGGERLHVIDPIGYVEMLHLVASAEMVITDSGGLQEETSYLGVPCITIRPNTERPITCSEGTNQLIGIGTDELRAAITSAPDRRIPGGAQIELWDGRTAERIAAVLCG